MLTSAFTPTPFLYCFYSRYDSFTHSSFLDQKLHTLDLCIFWTLDLIRDNRIVLAPSCFEAVFNQIPLAFAEFHALGNPAFGYHSIHGFRKESGLYKLDNCLIYCVCSDHYCQRLGTDAWSLEGIPNYYDETP